MLIPTVFATFTSLLDKYIFGLLALCALLTTAVLAGAVVGADYALQQVNMFGDAWWAKPAQWVVHWAGTATATFAAWFLAPSVFPLISSLFLESIVKHLERKRYRIPNPASAPFWRSINSSLRFLAVSLTLNLLLLPLMFALPVLYVPLYYIVNAQLYGREYLELVGLREHTHAEVRAFRKTHRLRIYLVGGCVLVAFTLPVVNLIAPVLAAVLVTHAYHLWLAPAQAQAAAAPDKAGVV